MIAAITMNASIDKAYLVDRQAIGEVLRVRECVNTPGGKGLNVARVVRAMGRDVLASGLLGGFAGQWIARELEKQGVPCRFQPIEGETRSCINLIDPSGIQTEYLEPGCEVSAAELESFYDLFDRILAEADLVTISGSVPRGVPADCYETLVAKCRAQGKPVLLDTSGQLLIRGARSLPTLLKPNTDEIAQLLGHAVTRETAAEAARELHETGIPYAAISLGKSGAVLCCDEGTFRCAPPSIKVVNATGCGDSMIAGFAMGIEQGMPAAELLAFATAVAAANALEKGTGSVHKENVERLLGEVTVEKL